MARDYRIAITKDGKAELVIERTIYSAPISPNTLVPELVLRLDRFIGQHSDACEVGDLRLLGRALHQMLLEGGNVEVFVLTNSGTRVATPPEGDKNLGEVLWTDLNKHLDQDIRLSLEFHSQHDDLASFPWEFLYLSPSGQEGFFAAGEKISLSLTRRVEPLVTLRALGSTINVWVVSAAPRSLGTVANIDLIEDTIKRKLGKRGQVNLTTLRDTTWAKLKAALEHAGDEGPDFLHFIGHGRLEGADAQIALMAQQQGGLIDAMRGMDERPADVDWLDVREFAKAVSKRPPGLLFLQTCKSAARDRQVDGARNAAQEFAAVEVPFVVAMQYEIDNQDAGIFAEAFYDALSKDSTVDHAVRAGRIKLGAQRPAWEHRRFATPVVYLRSDEPVLQLPDTQPAGAKIEGVKCPYNDCHRILTELDSNECACDLYRPINYCANDHPNRSEATVCRNRHCGVKLEPATSPAMTPAASANVRRPTSPGRPSDPGVR